MGPNSKSDRRGGNGDARDELVWNRAWGWAWAWHVVARHLLGIKQELEIFFSN